MPPDRPSVYQYEASVKSSVSDEAINTYLIRPMAGAVVRLLYATKVTPNQVTLLSTAAGLVAAPLFIPGSHALTAAAGLLVTLKDILDSADGQLARARQQYSRSGRFLDSIGDFLVNAALFAAIGIRIAGTTGVPTAAMLALAGFLGTTLRVSYHVFYQTAFLLAQGGQGVNRLSEEVRPEDAQAPAGTRRLQRLFLILYGWQDRAIAALDRRSGRRSLATDELVRRWSANVPALRSAATIGLGTDLFLLMLCALANAPDIYLGINLVLLNGVWCGAVAYRRWWVFPELRQGATMRDDSGGSGANT